MIIGLSGNCFLSGVPTLPGTIHLSVIGQIVLGTMTLTLAAVNERKNFSQNFLEPPAGGTGVYQVIADTSSGTLNLLTDCFWGIETGRG